MADQLYLSLWFPNFRLESLPSALSSVMRQFALISGEKRVATAAAYPLSFSEAPVYQRLFVSDDRSEDTSASIIENAVAEAMEQLHDDTAYEFEMNWKLWTPDDADTRGGEDAAKLDTLWRPTSKTVKIVGFGPEFDEGSYDQNGHVRVDFGLDYPWVPDECDEEAEDGEDNIVSIDDGRNARDDEATYIQKNVEMLLAFTLSVEKNCGISSRLLWTESGEPLAEKLIARLQRLN